MRVERIESHKPTACGSVVDALINAGMLESGVADAVFENADGLHTLTSEFRRISMALGHVLWHCWYKTPANAMEWRARALEAIKGIEEQPLPSPVELTVPEGFAYYAVYPEGYLEAARQCHAELGPGKAICIGLRSIGTTLSAAVAATLEELGWMVDSFTIRPRGHPFTRRPVLMPELERMLLRSSDVHYLLVDEGPGISGSSLAGTADLLGQLGIPDDQIILFPSWQTDGSRLRSAEARQRWRLHRQFSVPFEKLWIESGKLNGALPGWDWQELSGGTWRSLLYDDPQHYPAVQPQHERRKYLLRPAAGRSCSEKLLSFAGLGDRSGNVIRRGERLAEAGFTARPEGVVHGFLIRDFVRGLPAWPGGVDPELLETVARYLAHLSRQHLAEPSVSATSLGEMAAFNVAEVLGEDWGARVRRALPCNGEGWIERPVALDGRMQPHEWIHTESGYLKVDAFDHYDDHFLPGCQDIAWDLAGAAYELELDAGARRGLIERYRSLSGDHTITARLPHYAMYYLGYRLGYSKLATGVLPESPDRDRFVSAANRYGQLLRRELTHTPGAGWDV